MTEQNTILFHNDDVTELRVEIPEGHAHLRTTITLRDGRSFVFQEATVANLVRAYISVKTHPTKRKVVLKGGKCFDRKVDYAEWQLVEDESQSVDRKRLMEEGEHVRETES